MDIAQAIIFGVIEGITEFLPISSTGHLMLAARYMGIAQTEFVKSFEIAIQSGAILAVVALYGRVLLRGRDGWGKLLTAFLPTAVIGALLYRFIKQFLLGNNSVVLVSLFLGGAALILFERFHREKEDSVATLSAISYPQAFMIGLCQSLAVIPGVSRAAATIIGGLAIGLKRKTIVEFSFLLAVPTMAAAMAFDMLKSAHAFTAGQFSVLAVGFFVSFAVALIAIRLLLIFIETHTFVLFGVYRILVAVAFWLNFR